MRIERKKEEEGLSRGKFEDPVESVSDGEEWRERKWVVGCEEICGRMRKIRRYIRNI